jgi:DNA repair protein SbcD/Mre11
VTALKILHFADAHIDMANYGRHDAETGLPVRVMDFLKSLDVIVDAAIAEKVDLVLFAGDTYKDRNPAPTFQREWGRRIIKLSKAGIPTLLLVGNHDLSPSLGRAHALEEYNTLEVPFVKVLSEPCFLGPEDLWNLPLQVIALPWITRSKMMAALNIQSESNEGVTELMLKKLDDLVQKFLDRADSSLPLIFAAHASVQGAMFGSERSVMLGTDLVLSPSFVKAKGVDYVALGHIHKPQDLNEGNQPPVVYPGSIERIDFGEARDEKFYVIVELEKGSAKPDWRRLDGIRKFIDIPIVTLDSELNVMPKLLDALRKHEPLDDAVVRMTIDYPRNFETFIDESLLREACATTFEFHLVKRPQMGNRLRIPEDKTVGQLSPFQLLEIYWNSAKVEPASQKNLNQLAKDVIENYQDAE